MRAGRAAGLRAPQTRALTTGLVLTVAFVAAVALTWRLPAGLPGSSSPPIAERVSA